MDFAANGTVIAVAAILAVLIALVWYATTRLVTVAPNQAVIRAGKGAKGQVQIFTKGIVLFLPVIHQKYVMSLEQRQVELAVEGVDKNFITTSVTASLNFKFDDSVEGMSKAVQRFLTHSKEDLNASVTKSAEGVLRGIVSAMSVEDANNNRKEFQDQSLESAVTQFAEQGIQIDAFNISSVSTPSRTVVGPDNKPTTIDYLEEVGKPGLERAKREARIATSKAFQESEAARIEQEAATAALARDLAIKKSEFKAEEDRAAAIASSAHELAKAEQDVLVAELERKALAEKALVEQERLDIEVHKPADAQAYKLRTEAQAKRDADVFNATARSESKAIEADGAKRASIADAEARAAAQTVEAEASKNAEVFRAQGQATAVELNAKAEATAVEYNAKAEADAIRLRGEAEGASIAAIGAATASAEDAKATALTGHTQASLAFLAISALPEVVKASSDAMSGIDNYTVISSDGASDAVKQANRVVTEGLAMIKAGSGVDLGEMLSGLLGGGAKPVAPANDTPVAAAEPQGDTKLETPVFEQN
ncbi:SPFH domain-containing protein [Paeniglutamicibacter sp. R2-26]|uniref:SPFH domain-containing protein n=1 Tax=Paeniglutamicibacter sp. R2-26 TaxID=3144417 RepID=UPI003EE4EEF3